MWFQYLLISFCPFHPYEKILQIIGMKLEKQKLFFFWILQLFLCTHVFAGTHSDMNGVLVEVRGQFNWYQFFLSTIWVLEANSRLSGLGSTEHRLALELLILLPLLLDCCNYRCEQHPP